VKPNLESLRATRRAYFRRYYEKHRALIKARSAAWRRGHLSQSRSGGKLWYASHKQLVLSRAATRYRLHRTRLLVLAKTYRETHRVKIRLYKRRWSAEKRISDPAFRLSSSVRRAVTRAFNARGKTPHGASFFRAVGYSAIELFLCIDAKLSRPMTWSNYGVLWELDHILPLCRFKFNSMNDPAFRACWALWNLRPRLVGPNRADGGRLSGLSRTGRLMTFSSAQYKVAGL
jgi:hypothetical protein